MDTGLIFPDFYTMRRKDGVQYALLIIGFEFVSSGCLLGKSGRDRFSADHSSDTETRRFVKGDFAKRAFEKIF